MGNYLPGSRRRRRSVADTLLEAEQEHYLDCPNADIPIRSAAVLLDLILFSIASTGIHQLVETTKASITAILGTLSEPATPAVILFMVYLAWLIKTAALFLYFGWTVMRFGGSPAKLLMGLRVVDAESGDRLDYWQVLLREALGKVFGTALLFGPIVAIVRPDRRAAHDLLSGSVVKRVRGGP